MLIICLHQLHDNILSLRMQVSLAVLLTFFVANGLIYSMKIDRLVKEDVFINDINDRRVEELVHLDKAMDYNYNILSDPAGTEFIAEAGFSLFYDTMFINPHSDRIPFLRSARATNNWMQRFELLDGCTGAK